MNTKQLESYTSTYNIFRAESKKQFGDKELHELLKRLHYLEGRLTRLNERACDDAKMTEEYYNKTSASLERAVKEAAGEMGFDIRFNGDPRGAAICFVLPSGRYNSWDGETWRIHW